jgi:hypothetical protein
MLLDLKPIKEVAKWQRVPQISALPDKKGLAVVCIEE